MASKGECAVVLLEALDLVLLLMLFLGLCSLPLLVFSVFCLEVRPVTSSSFKYTGSLVWSSAHVEDPAEDEGLQDAETWEAEEVAGRGDSNHVKSEGRRDEAVTNPFAPGVKPEYPRSALAFESSSLRRFIFLWELGVVLRYPGMCSRLSHFFPSEQDDAAYN